MKKFSTDLIDWISRWLKRVQNSHIGEIAEVHGGGRAGVTKAHVQADGQRAEFLIHVP